MKMERVNYIKVKTLILYVLLLICSANAQTFNPLYYNNINWRRSRKISAADSKNDLSLVGRWAWGQMGNTVVVGNYAYIGNGAMFQVLDVSQPSSPKIVSEILTNGLVGSIQIRGSYAYITGPFQIIDISDPLHLKIVAEPQVGDIILGFTIDGNYLYAGTFSGFVYIFDLTDPVNPKLLSTLNAGGDNTTSIVVMGNYLYTTAKGTFSIYEFDISNKTNPVLIAQWNDGSYLGWVYGYGKYLYFLSYNNYLRIYDTSLPGTLEQTASITTPEGIKSLFISDTLAYLGIYQDSTRFRIIDVADAHHPKIISSIYWTDPILDVNNVGVSALMALVGNTGYIATNDGLWVIDESDIYNVKTLSFFITSSSANWLAIDSLKHAYVATLFTGLKIIDYSDPSSPKLIGQYLPHDRVDYVSVSGNYAYVLGDTDLQVVNISNPASPVEEDVIPLAYQRYNTGFGMILASGSKLFVIGETGKLFTIDVSNPSAVKITNIITTKYSPTYISLDKNYLYVTELDSAIEIYNVSDLFNVKSISTINKILISAQIQGDYMYAITKCGFTVFSLTDPLKPAVVGCASNIPWGISTNVSIVAKGNLVYLAYNNNVILMDVSNKTSPIVKDTLLIPTYTGVRDISVVNNILIVAGADYGVFFYRNNLITGISNEGGEAANFILYQNYPNPFNPSTIIHYEIPNDGLVTLKIYDELGREVKTLVNQYQNKGRYDINFDASNLASGIYFYRIEAGNFIQTRKMLLLK